MLFGSRFVSFLQFPRGERDDTVGPLDFVELLKRLLAGSRSVDLREENSLGDRDMKTELLKSEIGFYFRIKPLFYLFLVQGLILSILLFLTACLPWDRGATQLFWQIGRPDNNNQEFALAPDRSVDYDEDGLFVVGQSDSRTDWPFVHPGPNDRWAGGRSHTFTVLFGVNHPPLSGHCRLILKLIDTHKHHPPRLRVVINGKSFDRDLPSGTGEASINGEPQKGRHSEIKITFPANLLQQGDNEIKFITLSGGWYLYDWVGLYTPVSMAYRPLSARNQVRDILSHHFLREQDDGRFQKIRFQIRHIGEPSPAILRIQGVQPRAVILRRVSEEIEIPVPAVKREKKVRVSVEVEGKQLVDREVILRPIQALKIFILPHSHTDVGYTEIQTTVAEKQVNHLLQGMEYAERTSNYPKGSQFVWNVEVLWAADLFMHRLSAAQRVRFLEAVKKGRVALNGMYLNELTGLCRPEELLRLFQWAPRLAEQGGVPIDSAMQSDIPGATWGTVTAMSEAGIKYFSTAPNYFDRIGETLVRWENRPFYWISPSGREKVLVWIPYKGYALSDLIKKLTPQFLEDYQNRLLRQGYLYDIAYIRWSAVGDNAGPDSAICDFVRDWNTRHHSPRLVIASTHTAFRALELRHGNRLPRVRGDWTSNWEDGAGSSALETAMNRASSDRLAQAEALWAMINPGGFPRAAFDEAWRQVLLFSEHTWGADISVLNPESEKTREQWEIKRSYANQAEKQSRDLLARALENRQGMGLFASSVKWAGKDKYPEPYQEIDVFNTTSWPRTELVTLSKDFPFPGGDRVVDDRGRPVSSQRLKNGELAFIAREVPPLAVRRYRASAGTPFAEGKAAASGTVIENGILHLGLDEKTGGIIDFRIDKVDGNLVDTGSGQGLNEYLYLQGDNPAEARRNGLVKISVKESGPLVASLLIESKAPGCRKLLREVRLTAGFDYAELIDTVDKKRLKAKSYYDRQGKESVNFAFPFNVGQGEIRMDIPWAVIRPEMDQIPGSSKNWLTVGRWADVSNDRFGVTWITLDAPLVEIGGITATLLNSQTDLQVWRKKIEPTQKLYSWVMNNHWGTNYRAFQEGPVVFRYLLRPHLGFNPIEASRLAIGRSQPLIAVPARGPEPSAKPLLQVDSDKVLVAGVKPSDDGKALIVRLFGAAGQTVKTHLFWKGTGPKKIWLSDTSERGRRKQHGPIEVPAYGLVTLRVEG